MKLNLAGVSARADMAVSCVLPMAGAIFLCVIVSSELRVDSTSSRVSDAMAKRICVVVTLPP